MVDFTAQTKLEGRLVVHNLPAPALARTTLHICYFFVPAAKTGSNNHKTHYQQQCLKKAVNYAICCSEH